MADKKMTKIDHIRYMREALKQARKAFKQGEVPIGAVVVGPDGTIIGRGYNKVEQLQQQNQHAEVRAINQACKKIDSWRLLDCSVYVTLEPCGMCMHLIKLSRMRGVVYGASSPLFGYRLDKCTANGLYNDSSFKVIKGIGEDEAVFLLKQFFKDKRKG